MVDDHAIVGKRFQVRAIARDRDGRELDIGKWTEVTWRGDSVVAPDVDRSAAEFGACNTCFGVHGFVASKASPGTIDARLGAASGTLQVTARQ